MIGVIINGFSRYLDYKDAQALGLSEGVWLSIGLGVFFASVIALLLGWQRLMSQRRNVGAIIEQNTNLSTIEFYRTREELTKARGKMETELKGAEKIWLATWMGKYFRSEALFNKHHIDRLLIIDPTGSLSKSHVKVIDEDAEDLEKEVMLTSKAAKKSGAIVRFADFPIMDAVIIVDKKRFRGENDFTDEAWVRVETAIPFRDPNNCPNFVVYKSKDPQLFQALIEHYCTMWDMSTEQPTIQPEVKAYSPANKLSLVVQKIAEAKRITPKGKDTTVYLSEFLNVFNIEEVKTALLKLQDDDKVLTIKYFPDHLLPFAKFTKEVIDQSILEALHPSREQFRVETNDKFDDFAKQLGLS